MKQSEELADGTTVRPAIEDDDDQIIEIVNSINPDRIALTHERFRANVRSQPPSASLELYVAESDGRVIGYLWLNRLIYVPDPHVWYAEILVDPAIQGRGIGSRLYEHLVGRLGEHRARRVHSVVREDLPAARAFAAQRGFQETEHGERPSRLDVQAAKTESGRLAAERLKAEGIRITTLAELGGDAEGPLRDIHELTVETYADKPRFEDLTTLPFEEWQRIRAERGERADMVWVAMDGSRFVGIATLLQQHADSARAGYTGVSEAYRGRGVARALKSLQVEWAREHGIRYLFTENDVTNAPMLRVNTDMGYRPLPADLELVKDLAT